MKKVNNTAYNLYRGLELILPYDPHPEIVTDEIDALFSVGEYHNLVQCMRQEELEEMQSLGWFEDSGYFALDIS